MTTEESKSKLKGIRDWRTRLSHSRDEGTGFAAPGGEFTRALFEWSFTPKGKILHSLLQGRRVVELGAGMMSYGYALASVCGAKNFVAVEPFYYDIQEKSILSYLSKNKGIISRIPYKIVAQDMLAYLEGEPDDLLCVMSCGIEDCILPGPDYRKKVENQIIRTMEKDSFFLSSHSDLFPKSLNHIAMTFLRPSNPRVVDRLRIHGSKCAYERYRGELSSY
ncbi:MAG: hypothetical protein HOK41_17460 [Nitrospina sp.]|nr:hypothetical protein [Opitutae bacterium]MBT5472395.1 hypothetical protein [Nitrospina sp.]MBT5715909.1 hypothetical protein [Opitutae bacterium]